MEREGAAGAGAEAAGGAGGDENVIGALAAEEEAAAAGEGAEEVKAEAAAFFAAAAEEEEEAAGSLRASRNMAPRSLSGAAAEARTDEEGGQEGRPRFGARAVVADPLIARRHGVAVVVGICLFDFEFLSPGDSVSLVRNRDETDLFSRPLGAGIMKLLRREGREARS